MMVLGGRLRTLRRVSLIRAVVAWSLAVLFQMEMMSSWREAAEKPCLKNQTRQCVTMYNRLVCVCLWVYLEAYRHHGPTDLLSNHELLPEHGQDQVLPATRRQAFPQTDNPLPTHPIGIVLKTTGMVQRGLFMYTTKEIKFSLKLTRHQCSPPT